MIEAYPIAILIAASLAVYVIGRISKSKTLAGLAALVAMVLSGYVMYTLWAAGGGQAGVSATSSASPVFATFEMNPLAWFVAITSLGLGIIVAFYSIGYMHKQNIGKYYALLLMMIAGMIGVGMAADLFNMFIMFELMSVASFALVAFEDDREPIEAGIKYVLLSAMGSMIALAGIVIVYTYTGTLNLNAFRDPAIALQMKPEIMLAVAALFIAGFGVKAAIVPMHTWLPDAHSAAPSGISAMLSGMVISVGLITMIKSLAVVREADLGLLIPILALITMFAGNLMAMVQKDLKRMLAYSSIAHMGYILAGVGVALSIPDIAGFDGFRGGLFHIFNHAIFKGGAFLCAGAIITAIGTRDLKELAGIGRKLPVMGVSFAIFVLALVGAPPMNGFVSKLFICTAAMQLEGWGFVLMVAVIFNSMLSLFYYIPALNAVLLAPKMSEKVTAFSGGVPVTITIGIFILALLTLYFGIDPQAGLQIVDPAAQYLADLF